MTEAGETAGRVVELFAGVGGFRLGLERAGGWRTVWANQWEPSTKTQHAFGCYVRRFFEDRGEPVVIDDELREVRAANEDVAVNEDIAKVLDQIETGEREQIPDHDMLVGGFPCFAAGTMILTADGFRPIEEIREGDLVLTHRGRWRAVTATTQRRSPSTLILRGQGFPDIRTTDEHPFWSRELLGRSHEGGRPHRVFGESRWIEAGNMKASRTYVCQVLPHEPPTDLEVADWTTDLWWLVGRYLADGWRVSRPKGRVVICASHAEADEVEERIRRVFPCTRSEERTVVKFHITRQRFHDWLEPFGHGAAGKRVPGWVLSLPAPMAAALLDGHLTGDGHRWQGGWRATTVSRALALSIALLAQRAWGVVASIHEAEVPPTTTIEGREVNQRKQYQVVIPPRNRSAFVSGGFGWKLVRSVRDAGVAEVYNLSVDEDESYVADGCVVHNCQDYSVAKTLNTAHGIEGRKGVLWWSIYRILEEKRPRLVLLENVDRLLKSPATQRGRDFAIILACLADLGYMVEWRVVNAARYGFPQRRRRVFIFARQLPGGRVDALSLLYSDGVLARALPVWPIEADTPNLLEKHQNMMLDGHPAEITQEFGLMNKVTPFLDAGVMIERKVWTRRVVPSSDDKQQTLGDLLVPNAGVPSEFFIPDGQLDRWRYLKGAKHEERQAANGHRYHYSEGAIAFPDPPDQPSRTILTGEGGSSPSRFKHVVATEERYRRLTPVELERLNGFPDGWTEGMSDGRRAFMMGNALVVGLVERVGRALAEGAQRRLRVVS